MPFKNSISIFDTIKQALENIPEKKFSCERADVKYTTSDIWCQKICRSIRRAKYLVVDTTGLNANVFYELGFAHALGHSKNIIITQDLKQLPFDVSGFSAIEYSEKNFPKLRQDLQRAVVDLETDEIDIRNTVETSDEIIRELKSQLKEEETRSEKFKIEARASEKREEELKNRIAQIESIQENPETEMQKLIADKEGEIARLQKEISFIDQTKKEVIISLEQLLKDEKQRRQELEEELKQFKQTGNTDKLTKVVTETTKKDWKTKLFKQGLQLRDLSMYAESAAIFLELFKKVPEDKDICVNLAYCLYKLKRYDEAISAFQQTLTLAPDDVYSQFGLGNIFYDLKRYDEAITSYSQGIALNSKIAYLYDGLGNIYRNLKKFDDASAAYQKAIALDPKSVISHRNLAYIYQLKKIFESALKEFQIAIEHAPEDTMTRVSYANLLNKLGRVTEYQEQISFTQKYIDKENEYNRACFAAVCGNIETAFQLLQSALEKGDVNIDWARIDPDLDSIRDSPRFQALVNP